MKYWTDGTNSVKARSEQSARKKIEAATGYGVGLIRRDEEREEWDALPDCECGWSGQGSGPGGRFVRGDRCPACGMYLD